MSPNLNHRPGSGPTEDEFENTRIIGTRQYEAAERLAVRPGAPVDGGFDSRLRYVDLAGFDVAPEFTGDGRWHRTGRPNAGAAALAGTREGPGFRGFHIGPTPNPFWDGISRRVLYRLSAALRDAQAPKGLTPLGGLVHRLTPLVQTVVPVQLLRLGQLHLIGIPGEVTITAGLRLRREVATVTGAEVTNVLVAGYSNAYMHYVTTPEEYDAQCYEGGSTLFGRWELPALTQIVSALARAMHESRPLHAGTPPPDLSGQRKPNSWRPPADRTVNGREFGDVLVDPDPSYQQGSTVRVMFAGAYPNNVVRRGDTYVEVQHQDGDEWRTVADDGDWSTTFAWTRAEPDQSMVTVTWTVPAAAPAGTYRIRYHGDAREPDGTVRAFTGTSRQFLVLASETA
jgi:neutral ceramidase